MFEDGSENQHLSVRVNSARLADFVGQTVRLPCKAISIDAGRITVEASDGGQIAVQVPSNADVRDTYIEIIGKVVNPTTISMLACINLGSELDMKLVNDTIELIHDPRFYKRMFGPA
ncbi:hypothetical protein D9619_007948 [Psilocybe cf. subviscida]|uniref:Replication factor A protein 3 n=1 Tax=Psilocybe cf. subviscida TaxID=2480587 RepID=A0A8H5ET08_9AGAR|nr:hypothetical protein D9619_007948 [Psilocybe cf. subviscida]